MIADATDSTHPDLKICSQPEIEYWKNKSIDFKKFPSHVTRLVVYKPGSSKKKSRKLVQFFSPLAKPTFFFCNLPFKGGNLRYLWKIQLRYGWLGLFRASASVGLGVYPYPTFFAPRNSVLPMARHLSEMITGTKCEIFPSISSVDESSELHKWLGTGGIF